MKARLKQLLCIHGPFRESRQKKSPAVRQQASRSPGQWSLWSRATTLPRPLLASHVSLLTTWDAIWRPSSAILSCRFSLGLGIFGRAWRFGCKACDVKEAPQAVSDQRRARRSLARPFAGRCGAASFRTSRHIGRMKPAIPPVVLASTCLSIQTRQLDDQIGWSLPPDSRDTGAFIRFRVTWLVASSHEVHGKGNLRS